jgi:hypothetical protein
MKLSNEHLIDNLKYLGLVSIEDNAPVSYSGFKNRASVHNYDNKYKIVFVGQLRKNLFGFYVVWGTDSQVMKEAYEMFTNLVKGSMTDYLNDEIQWSNEAGIPLGYGNLKPAFFNEINLI